MGINKDLGLPFGKMEKLLVLCDVDGTLIGEGINSEYHDIIQLIKTLSKFKNIKVIVWSGGGKQYASTIGHRLGLDDYVTYASKLQHEKIRAFGHKMIVIDDVQDTALGDINLIVRNK